MLSVGLLLLWKKRPSSNRAKEACPLIAISYVYSVNFYNSWTHHNSQVAVGMMPFAGVHLREQPWFLCACRFTSASSMNTQFLQKSEPAAFHSWIFSFRWTTTRSEFLAAVNFSSFFSVALHFCTTCQCNAGIDIVSSRNALQRWCLISESTTAGCSSMYYTRNLECSSVNLLPYPDESGILCYQPRPCLILAGKLSVAFGIEGGARHWCYQLEPVVMPMCEAASFGCLILWLNNSITSLVDWFFIHVSEAIHFIDFFPRFCTEEKMTLHV